MATVSNCNLPDDLLYWVEKHTWARREADGTLVIGITDVAQHLAKSIISATPLHSMARISNFKPASCDLANCSEP